MNISKIEILFDEKSKSIERINMDTSLNYLEISRFFDFLSTKYRNEHEIIVKKLVEKQRKDYAKAR